MSSQFEILKTYIENTPEIFIEKDDKFYRARKNETGEKFTDEKLNAPPLKKCNAGRLNPAGVRYLYIADSPKTAIYEVRPWIGVKVEIAECLPKERLILKDLTSNLKEEKKENSYRKIIDENFSKPVSLNNHESDYLITQCIAKYIRDNTTTNDGKKFNGIKYSSSADIDGYNIVIFNPDKVEVINSLDPVIINKIDIDYQIEQPKR